jgi:hypothetical protein
VNDPPCNDVILKTLLIFAGCTKMTIVLTWRRTLNNIASAVKIKRRCRLFFSVDRKRLNFYRAPRNVFLKAKLDELVKSQKTVIPAKAGIQKCLNSLDSVSSTE